MHNWRTNSAWNRQTVEARARSTLVGTTSHSKLRNSRDHLPVDETFAGDSRGKGPIYGSQHGKNSRTFHSRENVDIIKLDHTNHRHTKNITELVGFSTSAGSDSWSNCRSLHIENTNHQTSQPMKIKHKDDYSDGQRNFLYFPISSRRRNVLFVGEMLEEQVGMPTWTIADLVSQPANERLGQPPKVV